MTITGATHSQGHNKPFVDGPRGPRGSIAHAGPSRIFDGDHASEAQDMEVDERSTSQAEFDDLSRPHGLQYRHAHYAQPQNCHDSPDAGQQLYARQRESSLAIPIQPPASTSMPPDTFSRTNFPSYTSLQPERPLLTPRLNDMEDSFRAHIPSPVSSTRGVASPNALERRIDNIESRLDRSRQRDSRGRISPGSRSRPSTAFPYEVPSHWASSSGAQRPSPPRMSARDSAGGELSHHSSPDLDPTPILRRYRHVPEELGPRGIPVNDDASVPSPRPSPYPSSFSASFHAVGEPSGSTQTGLRHRPVSQGMLPESGSSLASQPERDDALANPFASSSSIHSAAVGSHLALDHPYSPPVNPYIRARHPSSSLQPIRQNTIPPPGNHLGAWDSSISLALIRHEAERTTERDRILADIRERDRERGPIVSAMDIEAPEEVARRRALERARHEVPGSSSAAYNDRQRIVESFRARQRMRDQLSARARYYDVESTTDSPVAGTSSSAGSYSASEEARDADQRGRDGRFGSREMVLGPDGREILNRDVNDFVDRRLGVNRAPLSSSGHASSSSHPRESGLFPHESGPANGPSFTSARPIHGTPQHRQLWGEVAEEGFSRRLSRRPPMPDLGNPPPVSFSSGPGGLSNVYDMEDEMFDYGDEDDFLMPHIPPWGQDGTPASAIAALQDTGRRRVPTDVIAALLARRRVAADADNGRHTPSGMSVEQGDELRSIMEHLVELGDGGMSHFASLAGLGSASISGKKLEPGMGEDEVKDTVECVVKYVKRSRDEKRRKWVGEMLENIPWGEFGTREEMERDEYCSVCHDDYEETTEISITPCKHMYHKDCLTTWLGNPKTSSCPMCRRDLAVLSVLSSMVPDKKVQTALPYWHRT
ncbi:hypothetical protein IAR50_001898 [Cryptococcus sp. DSM 104548]